MEEISILDRLRKRGNKYCSSGILQKEVEAIISELAIKYNLTKEQVRLAYISQFNLVKTVIERTDFNDPTTWKYIRLPRLGIFKFKPMVVRRLKKEGKDVN